MSLFEEIKRRKVFRLALAYLVVAWVIVQIVDVIKEPLSLPGWFDTVVIVFLAIMFPVALLLSWAYDVTPDGVVRDGKPAEVKALRIDYGKIAFVAVLVLGAFLAGNDITNTPSPSRSVSNQASDELALQRFRFGVSTAMDLLQGVQGALPIAITPDGQTIIVHVSIDGHRQLYSRSLDRLDFTAIAGTENAGFVFAVSPDGQSVAFRDTVDGYLKKVALAGGPTTRLIALDRVRDLTWGDDGFIVFGVLREPTLFRVPDVGGEAEELFTPDDGESYKQISLIPGTDTLVLSIGEIGSSFSSSDRIAFLRRDGEVIRSDVFGASPTITRDGHIVYFSGSALWLASFDLSTLEIGQERVPVAESVLYGFGAAYALSDTGGLVYQPDDSLRENTVVLVDRDGTESEIPLRPGRYLDPSVSPDGRRLAIVRRSAYGPDLWIHSLDGRESLQVTSEQSIERAPSWDPSGRFLYFSANRRDDIFRYELEVPDSVVQLTDTETKRFTRSISPDGQELFFWESERGIGTRVDIGVLDLTRDAGIRYLLETPVVESHPAISPNGRWLAYASSQSGASEIYVRPYPNVDDGVWQVSKGGGRRPDWGPDSREIFYWGETSMTSVLIETEPEFRASGPTALFSLQDYNQPARSLYYTALDKFVVLKDSEDRSAFGYELVFVRNWRTLSASQ